MRAKQLSVAILIAAVFLISSPLDAFALNYRYGIHTSYLDSTMANRVTALGTGWVRLVLYWHEIQPTRNDWNNADLMNWLTQAESRGIKVLLLLQQTPSWAGPDPLANPTNIADWQEFVRHVIQDVSTKNVEVVLAIWNEVNATQFYTGSKADYGALVQASDAARNQQNTNIRLLALEFVAPGTMSDFDSWLSYASPYLRSTDLVGIHWYSPQNSLPAWLDWAGTHSGGREVWLTETGYNTCVDQEQYNGDKYIIDTFDFNGNANVTKMFLYFLHGVEACNDRANIIMPTGHTVDGGESLRPAYFYYADRVSPGSSATLWHNRSVSLQSDDLFYVVAENGGGNVVNVDRPSRGPWETFVLIDHTGGSLWDGDYVSFKTNNGINYFRDEGNQGQMTALATSSGSWGAKFTIYNVSRPRSRIVSGDIVALQGMQTSSWIVAAEGGGGTDSNGDPEMVTVSRTQVQAWEKFIFRKH